MPAKRRGATPLKQLSFSLAEYKRRLKAVQARMRQDSLAALVLTDLANICYLTGFQTIGSYGYGLYATIVPATGAPILFASDFESHNARIVSWLDDVALYRVQDQITGSPVHELSGLNPENPVILSNRSGPQVTGSPVEQLARVLEKRGLDAGRIGCERLHFAMTVRDHETFASKLPRARFVDASDLVEQVKIVKSAEEIAVLRRAAQITTTAVLAAIDAAAEGALDNRVAAAAYEAAIRAGGEYFSLQPVVTSGRRSGIPHSTFRRVRLDKGDCVFLEISAAYERYSAPTLRTISIGPPRPACRRAFEACQASVTALRGKLRHGASSRDTAQAAGKALRAVEPKLLWHGYYGYSVGLAFPPACSDCKTIGDITETTDFELKAGMVFHCNTSLRKPGRFGVTLGDTVLITQHGSEPLTSVPEELILR
ncbi:MAG: Xaa-Pro peptidase family protein [Planctomycetota bacterium]